MIDEIFFGINAAILVFLAFSIILMFTSKKFESKEFYHISDMLNDSLIIFGIIVLVDFIFSIDKLGYLPTAIALDFTILTTGVNLILVPLIAVIFLGAVISLRE